MVCLSEVIITHSIGLKQARTEPLCSMHSYEIFTNVMDDIKSGLNLSHASKIDLLGLIETFRCQVQFLKEFRRQHGSQRFAGKVAARHEMTCKYNRPQMVEVTIKQRAVVSKHGLLQKLREVPFFT